LGFQGTLSSQADIERLLRQERRNALENREEKPFVVEMEDVEMAESGELGNAVEDTTEEIDLGSADEWERVDVEVEGSRGMGGGSLTLHGKIRLRGKEPKTPKAPALHLAHKMVPLSILPLLFSAKVWGLH
jgi:hypothetical protein